LHVVAGLGDGLSAPGMVGGDAAVVGPWGAPGAGKPLDTTDEGLAPGVGPAADDDTADGPLGAVGLAVLPGAPVDVELDGESGDDGLPQC
jgi:hypothetical protein